MAAVKTLNGLLMKIHRGEPAELEVISRDEMSPVWKQGRGIVTLNLGYGKFPIISQECYDKVRDSLVIKQAERRAYEPETI